MHMLVATNPASDTSLTWEVQISQELVMCRRFQADRREGLAFADAAKRRGGQGDIESGGDVAQRRPHPRAGGEPGRERGDHRRPRRQSSRRA